MFLYDERKEQPVLEDGSLLSGASKERVIEILDSLGADKDWYPYFEKVTGKKNLQEAGRFCHVPSL